MNDLIGVFTAPGQALAGIMEHKKWLVSLLILVVVVGAVVFITYPITKADQAAMVKNSKMAERLTDEQLESMDKVTTGGRLFAVVFGVVFLGLALALGTFFVYLFYKIAGAEGLYVHYFSVVAAASLIDVGLGKIVGCALTLAKKTAFVSTGLTALIPNLDMRSFSFMLLSQFDFFGIWFIIALALGVAAYAKITVKKSLSIACGYFAFKALVLTLVGYVVSQMFMR